MEYPTVPPPAATEPQSSPPPAQAAPAEGPAKAFVPFHNENYRLGLGRIGADWHPAMRLTLVLGSVLLLGAALVATAWGYASWGFAR